MVWHLLSPEYPPDCGGVGDYSALLAAALVEAEDEVHVWHPPARRSESIDPRPTRLRVHELPDRFGRASREVFDRAFTEAPGTVLIQYVPNAFGLRGGNIPFCRWLLRIRRTGADVRVMFHEPFFYFGFERPWRNALAVTQRLMATLLIRASSTVYVSTETWIRYLAPFGPLPDIKVLPVPATLALDPPPAIVTSWRDRVRSNVQLVIGHFGSYGDHVGEELRHVLPAIWRALPHHRVLLVGRGSREFADRVQDTVVRRENLVATGRVSAIDAAAALRACDLLIAPFPDGATTRRTSLMAALSSGRAVVTTDGPLTEGIWRESGAVALAAAGDSGSFAAEVTRLAADEAWRSALGARGRRLYDSRFDLAHSVRMLRHGAAAVV